ncbi:phage protein NinX family protein [Providencia rettgeri]|uniref:phage protein NinX family protein n=1 Tax=Providencia rettgeri TaxID=587 RepID=UPI001BCF8A57|nr:phage protein NinX family protein [Providencia rettgeri]
MNKYTEPSDFEINKAVFHKAKIKHKYFRFLPNGVITYNIKGKYQVFDPCNNPADAMPIIIENKICTAFDVFAEEHDGGNWVASPAYGFANERTRSNNLYRAAMELFLLMKDVENSNGN